MGRIPHPTPLRYYRSSAVLAHTDKSVPFTPVANRPRWFNPAFARRRRQPPRVTLGASDSPILVGAKATLATCLLRPRLRLNTLVASRFPAMERHHRVEADAVATMHRACDKNVGGNVGGGHRITHHASAPRSATRRTCQTRTYLVRQRQSTNRSTSALKSPRTRSRLFLSMICTSYVGRGE